MPGTAYPVKKADLVFCCVFPSCQVDDCMLEQVAAAGNHAGWTRQSIDMIDCECQCLLTLFRDQ